MPRVQLEDWAVTFAINQDPYTAPEMSSIVLIGKVTGHPCKPDGSTIRTSAVKHVISRFVWTNSGTCYHLGEPSQAYREWLKSHHPDWDPENPITIK